MINIFQVFRKNIIKIRNLSILPFLGFILISFYIWGRYIRTRLPRDIPFNLTLWWLVVLIFMCCGYIYIIYRILNPKMPPQIILNFIGQISNIIKAFDNYLKQFSIVSQNYKYIFISLANLINYNNFVTWKKLLIIIDILPQLILLFALIIDVFYYQQLFYFYKVIWMTLLLFLVPFCLYTFNYINELLILYWERNSKHVRIPYMKGVLPPKEDFMHEEYDDSEDDFNQPPGYMFIPFRTFIQLYFNEIYFCQNTPNFRYSVEPTIEWRYHFFKTYNLTWESSFDKLEFNIIAKDVNIILQLSSILYSHKLIITYTNVPYIQRYMKALIYLGYLICWGYILYKSLHTLQDFNITIELLEILKEYAKIEEPFSQSKL